MQLLRNKYKVTINTVMYLSPFTIIYYNTYSYLIVMLYYTLLGIKVRLKGIQIYRTW